MRVPFWFKIAAVVPFLAMSSLTPCRAQDSGQQSSGDEVADAARRSREEKKAASAKPKKVYTDDDISHRAPDTAPSQAPGNVAATPDPPIDGTTADPNAKPGEAKPADSKNEEASWRKRFKAQRDKIAAAEKELDVLQREDEKAQLQYYPDPQKALSEQYTRKDINDKRAKIDAKKAEIEQLKQGLADLEDQLRKAGGDSGWAR